jgi:hypothetical protein
MLHDDVLYELMYFIGVKDLANFGTSCQRFNQLVVEFNRRKQGKSILHQWKYTLEILEQNYQKIEIDSNSNDLTICDVLSQTKDMGFTILLIRHNTIYQFCLYSLLSGSFYCITDCKGWNFMYLGSIHSIQKTSTVVYHGMFRDADDLNEKSIIFDCKDPSKITFNVINQAHYTNAASIVNPVTRLHHCQWCKKLFPDLNINDIPESFCDFDKLPSGDRYYLSLSDDGYLLCRELGKTMIKIITILACKIQLFF